MANSILFQNLEKQTYARREAFNSLRTNLQFCGVDNKVIMFTSCTPDEGKSTVTMELARSLNDDGKKVVLVDADLRKSVFVGRYRIHSEETMFGLSHYLSGQKKMDEVINHTNIENLDMIIAGPVAPNPTELLGRAMMWCLWTVRRLDGSLTRRSLRQTVTAWCWWWRAGRSATAICRM